MASEADYKHWCIDQLTEEIVFIDCHVDSTTYKSHNCAHANYERVCLVVIPTPFSSK
jgi:hypothetical protein